jgi:hypothetical protein
MLLRRVGVGRCCEYEYLSIWQEQLGTWLMLNWLVEGRRELPWRSLNYY